MVNTVVFLWISAGAATVASPSAPRPSPEAVSTLRDFGRARGLSFVSVERSANHHASGRPLGSNPSAANLADAVEAELEQARTALSALEEASAEARLARVESQLLTHPYLPQAAFLMGECLALQAQAARERSAALALRLEARRAALEGERAPEFGAPLPPTSRDALRELSVTGLGAEDELELDAASLGLARQVRLAPGLHHLRVWRRGRPIFAAFMEVSSDQNALVLSPPALAACSQEDLEDAASAAPSSGIACERWAKVREQPEGIAIALCEHERCGPFLHWRRRAAPPFAPIGVERGGGLPAWATATLAGAGAVLATGLVLWQAGAFDQGRPSAASWEYGGLNPQATRF